MRSYAAVVALELLEPADVLEPEPEPEEDVGEEVEEDEGADDSDAGALREEEPRPSGR